MVIYVSSNSSVDIVKYLREKQSLDESNTYISPLLAFSFCAELDMENCIDLLSICDKLVVVGDLDERMQGEVDFANLVEMEIDYDGE